MGMGRIVANYTKHAITKQSTLSTNYRKIKDSNTKNYTTKTHKIQPQTHNIFGILMLIAISLLFNFTLKCAHKKSYSTYILSAFHLHDSIEIKVKERRT